MKTFGTFLVVHTVNNVKDCIFNCFDFHSAIVKNARLYRRCDCSYLITCDYVFVLETCDNLHESSTINHEQDYLVSV